MDEGAPAKVQHVRIELQTPRNNVWDQVAKLQGEGEEFGAAAVSKEEGRNLPNSCADRCHNRVPAFLPACLLAAIRA